MDLGPKLWKGRSYRFEILWRYLPLVFIRQFYCQNTFRQIGGKLEDFFIRLFFTLFDVLNLFPGYCPRVTGRSVYRQGLVGFLSYYALSPSHRSPAVYLSAERMQHCPAKQLSWQAGGGHGSTLALILINELLLRFLYLNSHSLRSARLSLFVLNEGKKCSLPYHYASRCNCSIDKCVGFFVLYLLYI